MSFIFITSMHLLNGRKKKQTNGANTNIHEHIRTQNASRQWTKPWKIYLHITWYVFGSNWSVKVTRTKRKSFKNSKTAYTVLWITKIWDRTWKRLWGKPNICIVLACYICIHWLTWNEKKRQKKKQRKNFSIEKKKVHHIVTTHLDLCGRRGGRGSQK